MFWKKKSKEKFNDEKLNNDKIEDTAKPVFAFFLGIMVTVFYFTDFGLGSFIPKSSYREYQELEKMVNRIEKSYYRPVDRDMLYEGMRYGTLAVLEDKYSYYMNPDTYKTYIEDDDGIFFGYGLQYFKYTEDSIIIGYIMEGSPAEKAGLLDGDEIVRVNGKSVEELGIEQAKEIMFDKEEQTVELGIKRQDAIVSFTLTRAEIKSESVNYELIDKVGYIRITEFINETGDKFESAVDNLLEEGAEAFVIDFRNNGGGILDVAIQVADRILPKSTITYTQTREGKREYYYATDEKTLEVPIIILTNRNSASASELVAAALKENEVAKTYGAITFGKGVVQRSYVLNEGAAFKLTISEYFSPNGNKIDKIGVLPDVEILQDETIKLKSPEDIQLQTALDDLKKQIK